MRSKKASLTHKPTNKRLKYTLHFQQRILQLGTQPPSQAHQPPVKQPETIHDKKNPHHATPRKDPSIDDVAERSPVNLRSHHLYGGGVRHSHRRHRHPHDHNEDPHEELVLHRQAADQEQDRAQRRHERHRVGPYEVLVSGRVVEGHHGLARLVSRRVILQHAARRADSGLKRHGGDQDRHHHHGVAPLAAPGVDGCGLTASGLEDFLHLFGFLV